jgi:hypothetical protein
MGEAPQPAGVKPARLGTTGGVDPGLTRSTTAGPFGARQAAKTKRTNTLAALVEYDLPKHARKFRRRRADARHGPPPLTGPLGP